MEDFDTCVREGDNTLKEPTREDIITDSRDLIHICRNPNKTLLTHKVMSDVLIGIKRFTETCGLLEKEAPVIEEKMMELAKQYRIFTNDLVTYFQELGLWEGENEEYLSELPPEFVNQWKIDNDSVVALVPSIKSSLHMMRMFTEGHASKMIKKATDYDPSTFVEGLGRMLSDDWAELADITAGHIGDLCRSAEIYELAANRFVEDLSGFLFDINGIIGNDDFFLG